MNEEKMKIMQMVKDGTISPEEGLDLIEALSKTAIMRSDEPLNEDIMAAEPVDPPNPPAKKGMFGHHRALSGHIHDHIHGHGKKHKAKWLFIKVNEGNGKNVNIKIPISLAKFAGKFIPNEAKKELKDQGIELDLDGILSSIHDEGEMNLVEVDEGDGKTVRIFTK